MIDIGAGRRHWPVKEPDALFPPRSLTWVTGRDLDFRDFETLVASTTSYTRTAVAVGSRP